MPTVTNANFKALRTATGLSKPQFAELLRVSFDTIVSIELGRLAVSEKIARRAFRATGALPHSLRLESVPPLAWTREEYTPQHFAQWRELIKGELMEPMQFARTFAAATSAARENGKLAELQAEINFTLFDFMFAEGIHNDARALAQGKGHGDDFDTAARLAGRIMPREEAAQ